MKSLLLRILTATCLISGANAQSFETSSPEIVSAWKLSGENTLLIFRYDGSYYQIDGDADEPGMERGTYTWDKGTQAFSVETIVDTNGDGGLSHPNGATTVSIGGSGNNTLSYTVVGEGEGTLNFSRVVNTASLIVGSWVIPGENFSVTFLSDNSYYLTEEANDIPFGYTGIEKGTYTWNSTTKAFSATAPIDTNGDVGVNGVPPGVTINITGNSLVFFDGEESTTLLRLTTNSTPVRIPEFGVTRFANYTQTSSGDPVLSTFNAATETYPYSADVFIDSEVNAIAPTLKIGDGTAFLIGDEGDGSFESEAGFALLSGANSLNSFLPASTALQFKSGTATANLSTPASLTFPTTPKIIVREGDAWISGVYRFGEDEVLQWTLPTGFVASQYFTILEVYDPEEDFDAVVATLQGEVTHFDLAGKLEPGKQYEVELEFYRIDSSTTTGTGVFSGKQGRSLSASSTIFSLRSLPDAIGPEIFEQPVSQPGTPGSPLLLTVGINEDAFRAATFQWFKNNQEIEGQTANSIYISSFDLDDDSGRYKVVVINDQGVVETDIANVGNVGTQNQHVQTIVASKRKISEQQSASLLTSIGASFDARVEGVGITATFPSTFMTLTKPNNSSLPLTLDEDHWDAETDFANFAALQSAFPDGIYNINIGSDSVLIDMSGTNFPNQPLVTSSVGTWVGGKLQITESQAAAGFTLTTNATTGDGFVTLSVIDIPTDEDLVYEVANTSPSDAAFVTAAISPGQLTVGQTYEVEAEFDEVIDSANLENKTWGAPPDGTANTFGLLSASTVFFIEVVPDPSGTPYTTWQSGFFNATQLANPAISGDDVDFDNDGIDNLLEFILGGSPTSPNPNLLKNATTTPAPGGRNLIFFYDRKTVANGITQVIETSPTLTGTWIPAVHGAAGVVIATSTLDANTQRVTATIPSTATKLFVRLNAMR